MRQIDNCSYVQLDHLELAILIKLDEVAHRAKAGIVDEHLDLELAFFRLFKQLRSSIECAQIERDVLGANAGQASELVAECDEFVFRARDQQHVSSACGEFSGKGSADSSRGSGDEGRVHFNSSKSSSIISALLAWSLLSVSRVGALSRLMRATAA